MAVTAAQQSDPVDAKASAYTEMVDIWQRCRDFYEGTDAVKGQRERYLPRTSEAMTEGGYARYLSGALLFPAVKTTVYGLAGTVLRQTVTTEGWADDSAAKRHQPLRDNVDGTGATLHRFLFASLRDDVLVTGRDVWIVDWSSALNRAVWRRMTAESLINWRTTHINGVSVLSLAVFAEVLDETPNSGAVPVFEPVQQEIRRAYWLDMSGEKPVAMTAYWRRQRVKIVEETTTRAAEYRDEWIMEPSSVQRLLRLGAALDFLPVIIVGALGVTPDVTEPPLKDLVDVNLSHFMSSADLEWGRHFTGLPTPWVNGVPDGVSQLVIGSGEAWILSGPDAGAGMLEFTGQGLQALEKALSDKESKMATLASRAFESDTRTAEAAETVRMRQSAERVTLDTLAQALAEAGTIALRWSVWWAGDALDMTHGVVAEGPTVAVSRDFAELVLAPDEMRAWTEMLQNEAISFETFYARLVAAKLAREGVTAEDEQAQIRASAKGALPVAPAAELPNDGEDDTAGDGE